MCPLCRQGALPMWLEGREWNTGLWPTPFGIDRKDGTRQMSLVELGDDHVVWADRDASPGDILA